MPEPMLLLLLLGTLSFVPVTSPEAVLENRPQVYAGLSGQVGAPANAQTLTRLLIDTLGIYENLIVDGEWGDFDLIQIKSDNVVLRNCTVRNGLRDSVEVYGRNVRIENCKIHHVLKGTFSDQQDAHGITGRPQTVVDNCVFVENDIAFRCRGTRGSAWVTLRNATVYFYAGEREAPPLAEWPYTRLLVADIIQPGIPQESANSVVPTELATGWEGNP